MVRAWHEVEVPKDPAVLEAELRKAGVRGCALDCAGHRTCCAGIKAAPRRAPRKMVEVKEKKARKKAAPRVLTNTHLAAQLFTASTDS